MEERYRQTADWDIKPDATAYSTVINAWSEVGTELAALRAERLLGRMEALYDDGDDEMKPTIIPVTACIKAWSNTVDDAGKDVVAEHVDELLSTAVEKYESGDDSMRPTDITFSYATKAMLNDTYGPDRIAVLQDRVILKTSV
mmetsp:Transcript_16742/g.36354  ORF Transcript_16742/g.36354 Transcript_16742/m.36354 type:complete len:143 (+) Transcript_16742:258-686(+)